ncbi:MAG: WD40 repeat domain-containing protein, partial [Byssovorax sp.]
EEERPGQRLRAFERHLREHPGALVIFDNVADPLALREPAAGVVPWDLPCRLLFTTRRRDPDPHFEVVPVSVLPEAAAISLLLSGKARQPTRDEGELRVAGAICRALGHLPLALVLAAAYLGKYPRLPLSGYLERLRREGGLFTADAAQVDPLKLATQHEAAIEATLRTQWDALANPQAQRVLMAAALLRDAAHVSRATLVRLTGLSDEARHGYVAPLDEAVNALSELSLVEEPTEQTIRLHPLVREFAAARIGDRATFAAECAARLDDALGEVAKVEREVRVWGLDAVLADLRLGEELGGEEGRERFRRLLRPLDRAAHCLRRWDPARDPWFFLQQVRNVSFELGVREVEAQAEAALAARGAMWLRERVPTSRESEALIRTLAGHTNSVWGVAVSPDGRTALSASHDQNLKVWDISSGCELRTLAGHAAEINEVAVTPRGDLAVSASEDRTLKMWDLATDRLVGTLTGHAAPVTGVAVTSEGRLAISASMDRTLKVWDLATKQLVRTLLGHTATVNGVAVTPDGRLAVSASHDRTLKVWDLGSGREVRA